MGDEGAAAASDTSGASGTRSASGVAAGSQAPGPRFTGFLSSEDLNERGFTSLWTKQPSAMEGPSQSVSLLPDGIFAVTRPSPEKRSWSLVRYGTDNGLPQWYYTLDEPLEHAPVTYRYPAGGVVARPDEVYILQKDMIRCLDLPNGSEMWRKQLPFPVSSGPVVDETQYYLGSYDRRIYALTKVNSIERWLFVTGGEIRAPGTVGGTGELYFASTDKSVVRLEPSTGWVNNRSWRFHTGGRLAGSPVFFSRWIFVGSTDFKLYCFEVDGTRAWDFPAQASIEETPTVISFRPDKPLVLCISKSERSGTPARVGWAIDAKTGKEVWRRENVSKVVGVGRKAIYVLVKDPGGPQKIVAVDALQGGDLFSIPMGSFDWALTNDADHGMNSRARGILYLASRTGAIQAIREKP